VIGRELLQIRHHASGESELVHAHIIAYARMLGNQGRALFSGSPVYCDEPRMTQDVDTLSSNARALADGELFWKISNGRGPMPPWKHLAEKEPWELVNYIRCAGGSHGAGRSTASAP
jgi:hypothetical protein